MARGRIVRHPGGSQLFGRDSLFDLIAYCLGYPKRRSRNHDIPFFVLLGPRGSGKTAMLGELKAHYSGRLPCGSIDFELPSSDGTALEVMSPPARALSRLAFDLGAWCKHFGRLRFPRLTVGLLATSARSVDRVNRDRARSDMKNVLSDPRVKKITDGVTALGDVIGRTQTPPVSNAIAMATVMTRLIAPLLLQRYRGHASRTPVGSGRGRGGPVRTRDRGPAGLRALA